MAYTITNSDGTILLTLADGKIDQLTTSLTLIGRDIASYGQYFNNDLIGLLENFCSESEPRSPVPGQLWFNKVDGRMRVFGLNGLFKPIAGALLSATQPTPGNFVQGDLWIDTTNDQMFFSPDGTTFVLAGPQYSTVSGKVGWLVETIASTLTNHIVLSLYDNDVLLGIASSSAFNFALPVSGMTSVQVGFNLNTSIPGIRFIGTATSTDTFQGFNPSIYLTNNQPIISTSTITVLNDNGLTLGLNGDVTIEINTSTRVAYLNHNATNKAFNIRGTNTATGYFTAMQIDSNNKRVGIFTESPAYSLDIVGDTRITGNLYVAGTSTIVESINMQIIDKNIELAYGQISPADTFIEGGGITLIGTTDHTISWTQSFAGAWQINDNLNLVSSTSSYKINGISVVNTSSLGSGILSAPGLLSAPVLGSIGSLSHLTITNVVISGSTVATTGSNVTLYLNATGSGTIDASNRKITNVSTCTSNLDAANKKYVDDVLATTRSPGYTLTIDVTNMINPNTEILPYLDKLLPVVNTSTDVVFNLPDGVRVRVLCSQTTTNVPQKSVTINKSFVLVDKNGTPLSQDVLSDASGVLPAFSQTPTITYSVKEFRVLSGAWIWTADIP
jgi:hypothetical protein